VSKRSLSLVDAEDLVAIEQRRQLRRLFWMTVGAAGGLIDGNFVLGPGGLAEAFASSARREKVAKIESIVKNGLK
jgi:hypothetical protein